MEQITDNLKEKSLLYYVMLPVIVRNIDSEADTKNYYTYKYQEFINKTKILPDFIEVVSFKNGILCFKSDSSAKLFNSKIKRYKSYMVRYRDNYYINLDNKTINDLKKISNGELDTNNKTIIEIFNFYSIYVRLDENIGPHVLNEDFKVFDDLANYIKIDDKSIYMVYMLSRIPSVIQQCANEEFGMEINKEDILNGYLQYKIKKELKTLNDVLCLK